MRSSRRDGSARRATAVRRRLKARAEEEESRESSDSESMPVTQNSAEQIRELTSAVTLLATRMESMYDQHSAVVATMNRRAAFLNQEISTAFSKTWGASMSDTSRKLEMRMLFKQCAQEEDTRARALTGMGLFARTSEWRENEDHVIEDEVVREWQGLQLAWPSTSEFASRFLPTGVMPSRMQAGVQPMQVVIGNESFTYSAAEMGPKISPQDMMDYAMECRRATATPVPMIPQPPMPVPVMPPSGVLTQSTQQAVFSTTASSPNIPEDAFQGKSVKLPYHTVMLFQKRPAQMEEFRNSWFKKNRRCDEYVYEMQNREEKIAFEAMDTLLSRFKV